jgi:5-methylcytosine-specific restriction protein A
LVFTHGNAAIRDHLEREKGLHLFEGVKPAYVRYVGQMICIGYQLRRGPDRQGASRQLIIFELTPLGELADDPESPSAEVTSKDLLDQPSLAELRDRAQRSAVSSRDPRACLRRNYASLSASRRSMTRIMMA